MAAAAAAAAFTDTDALVHGIYKCNDNMQSTILMKVNKTLWIFRPSISISGSGSNLITLDPCCTIWHFEPSNSMRFGYPNWLDASETSHLHLALHFCFCCWLIPCDVIWKRFYTLISAHCAETFSFNSTGNKSNVFRNVTQLLYDNCHPKFGRYVCVCASVFFYIPVKEKCYVSSCIL